MIHRFHFFMSLCVFMYVLYIYICTYELTVFSERDVKLQLTNLIVFSERELTFRFAICCRLSICLSSVCRLSVCRLSVMLVHPTQAGSCNFRQYFYSIRYLGHPLTFTENFTEISQGNPSAGELNPRGVPKYSDFHLSIHLPRREYV